MRSGAFLCAGSEDYSGIIPDLWPSLPSPLPWYLRRTAVLTWVTLLVAPFLSEPLPLPLPLPVCDRSLRELLPLPLEPLPASPLLRRPSTALPARLPGCLPTCLPACLQAHAPWGAWLPFRP